MRDYKKLHIPTPNENPYKQINNGKDVANHINQKYNPFKEVIFYEVQDFTVESQDKIYGLRFKKYDIPKAEEIIKLIEEKDIIKVVYDYGDGWSHTYVIKFQED